MVSTNQNDGAFPPLATKETIKLPESAETLPRDVRRAKIIGSASDLELPGNFHECEISNCHFVNVRFKYTDFLNAVIKDTKFENCYFEFGTVSGCALFFCDFTFSTLRGYSFQDTLIDSCRFSSTNIQTSMVRHSRIFANSFSQCLIDNKGFETSLLLENEFISTDLDFRAIQDNFGLNRSQIRLDNIRIDRSGVENPTYIDLDQILKWVANQNYPPLEAFRILYFDISEIDNISAQLPEIYSADAWTDGSVPIAVLPKTLSMFYELIRYEFDSDNLVLYSVSRMATLGYDIYSNAQQSLSHNEICQAALGVHTQATHLLNSFDSMLLSLPMDSTNLSIRFRTLPAVSDDEIYDTLNFLRKKGLLTKWEIYERHSPADLHIFLEPEALAAVSAMITLTRFKFELYRMDGTSSQSDEFETSQSGDNDINASRTELISKFQLGIPEHVKSRQIISFASRLPGNLMMTMSLAFTPEKITHIRRVLNKILEDDQNSESKSDY